MIQHRNAPLRAFDRFLRDLGSYRPRLLLTVFLLMLARSLMEGVSFVLLVPLLAGLRAENPAESGATAAAMAAPKVVTPGLGGGWLHSLLASRPPLATLLAIFLGVMLLRALLGYASTIAASAYTSGLTDHFRRRIYGAFRAPAGCIWRAPGRPKIPAP